MARRSHTCVRRRQPPYAPDGSPATNPKGMALAGRVIKGAGHGCIACCQRAGGYDYIYGRDRLAQ